jgi:hypothetical protein
MLRRIALALAVAAAFSGAMYTTTGCGDTPPSPTPATLHGTVTNARTGAPLSDVTIVAGGVSATTNAGGKFTMTVPPGTVYVTAIKNGFTMYSGTTITASGGNSTLDISLQPGQ